MIWLIFIAVFIILVLILLFSSMKIGIYYKRENENDRIKVDIGLINGLIPIQIKIPTLKSTDQGVKFEQKIEQKDKTIDEKQKSITPKKLSDVRRMINTIKVRTRDFRRILVRFMRKVKIVKFSWQSQIGTGDAFETGMLSGLAWIIKSGVVAVLSHFFQLQTRPELQIEPSFSQVSFYTEIECIVKLRIGDAILTGLLIYVYYRKGRKKQWQNIRFKA